MAGPPATHRVYMSFIHRDGWRCRFHDSELSRIPIASIFVFKDKDRIYQIAQRGHGLSESGARATLDKAVRDGRGGIWLRLTDSQYQSLKRSNSGVAA